MATEINSIIIVSNWQRGEKDYSRIQWRILAKKKWIDLNVSHLNCKIIQLKFKYDDFTYDFTQETEKGGASFNILVYIQIKRDIKRYRSKALTLSQFHIICWSVVVGH